MNGSRELHLGIEFSCKEGLDLENCLQVQSLKVKKNGLKELYLGSEFNSNEEWI